MAFTDADLEALQRTQELISLGILTPDSQAALVRTWGRSFARLAEWQVSLLAGLAIEGDDPQARLDRADGRGAARTSRSCRPTSGAGTSRAPPTGCSARPASTAPGTTSTMAVGVRRHRRLHRPEQEPHRRRAGRVGGVLRGRDDPHRRRPRRPGDQDDRRRDAVRGRRPARRGRGGADRSTERGADEDDQFPQVRAGIAYGEVVSRLGDVYGPTVNIAARLTSVARPGTVLVDRGPTRCCPGRSPRTVDDRAADREESLGQILTAPTSWPSLAVPRPVTTASGGCRAGPSRGTPGSSRSCSAGPRSAGEDRPTRVPCMDTQSSRRRPERWRGQRGRPAADRDAAPARQRAEAADPPQQRQAALRRDPVGQPRPGGARRVRRGAARRAASRCST